MIKSFSGIAVSSILNALGQFLVVFLIMKMGFVEESTSIAIAMGIGTPFLVLLNAQMSNSYLAANGPGFTEYYRRRKLSVILYTIFICGVFIYNQNPLIYVYLFYRVFDLLYDFSNSIIIKCGYQLKLYKISIIRLLSFLVPFSLTLFRYKSPIMSICMGILLAFIAFLFIEIPIIRKMANKESSFTSRTLWDDLKIILFYGLPIFIASAIPNLSRVTLGSTDKKLELIVYSTIFMLINSLSIITNSFIQSRISKFSRVGDRSWWLRIWDLIAIPTAITAILASPMIIFPDITLKLVFNEDYISFSGSLFYAYIYSLSSVALFGFNIFYVIVRKPQIQIFSVSLGFVVCWYVLHLERAAELIGELSRAFLGLVAAVTVQILFGIISIIWFENRSKYDYT